MTPIILEAYREVMLYFNVTWSTQRASKFMSSLCACLDGWLGPAGNKERCNWMPKAFHANSLGESQMEAEKYQQLTGTRLMPDSVHVAHPLNFLWLWGELLNSQHRLKRVEIQTSMLVMSCIFCSWLLNTVLVGWWWSKAESPCLSCPLSTGPCLFRTHLFYILNPQASGEQWGYMVPSASNRLAQGSDREKETWPGREWERRRWRKQGDREKQTDRKTERLIRICLFSLVRQQLRGSPSVIEGKKGLRLRLGDPLFFHIWNGN